MKKKNIIIIVVCAVVLIVVCILLFGGSQKGHKITYESEVVTYGSISEYITATGSIEPVTEVEVGTQVSGIIDKIYVDYNSEVKKGQLIAEMDRVTLQSEVDQQQASYNGSKAEYEYQKKNYERQKSLHEKGLVSDTDFEQAEYSYLMAEASLQSAEASLAKAKRNLSYATITSPIDGIVINKAVEEGQTVASGYETPTLFNIAADLTEMQVVADIDEADIGGVEVGQRVSFTVDAYPNDTFEGRVTQIRLGESDDASESVITYEVVISAPNPDEKLLPRLTANVNIYTVDRDSVLVVPNRALRFTPERDLIGVQDTVVDTEAENKVWTREGKTFTAHAVEIGITNGIKTEIVSGIAEGTRVVTEAVAGVMPGEEAAPVEEESGSTESNPFMPGPPGKK